MPRNTKKPSSWRSVFGPDEVIQRIRPTYNDGCLNNPHKGTTTFQRFNGDPLYPGLGWDDCHGPEEFPPPANADLHNDRYPPTRMSYCRWLWSVLEPRKGEFRWDLVDAALAICKPGVTGLELGRAAIGANDGIKPWIEHFYLAHGVGTDSAEMPLIGTDLGEGFDEALVMVPGMVLVFEPVIWDEGAAGYRSEDIVAITDDGWVPLSGTRYDPFEVTR